MIDMVGYETVISFVASVLSYFGAIVIFYGGIRAAIRLLSIEILKRKSTYNDVRIDFTSKIVVGLEFFIAGDLINTILVPDLNRVAVLAVIVAIRTIVGYSLNREIKELKQGDQK